VRDALRVLAKEAVENLLTGGQHAALFKNVAAYYDPRRDEVVRGLSSFTETLGILGKLPFVESRYGDPARLLLQFIYAVLGSLTGQEFDEAVFAEVWDSFWHELLADSWTYHGVANIQNFDGSLSVFDLPEGISCRHRSFDELRELLGWGDSELAALTNDWMEGHPGQYVLVVSQEVPKSKDLFPASGPEVVSRAYRMLLALRLLKPGDVRIGRMFNTRSGKFDHPVAGILTMLGQTTWSPGAIYNLTADDLPHLIDLYNQLLNFDTERAAAVPNVTLALRSFSSLYERQFHQAEDQIVDAVTALEALLHLDEELSFKLAYRASCLLAATEDGRVAIYETLRRYYKLRSQVVHGSSISNADRVLVQNNEPLREAVRSLLRGFLALVESSPGFRTKRGRERFYGDLDAVPLHQERREHLRTEMKLT